MSTDITTATADGTPAGTLERFPTKIAIVVREDLADWQKLNVTAFLASGIAHADDAIMGKRYEDGSGNDYLALFREPVLCLTADPAGLARTRARALSRELPTALYTADMFTTGNDDDNRAVVRAVPADALDLVGVAVHGPRKQVDKVIKGLKLHG
ncbi:hypothetical protein ADK70_39660 [Streptomyces rimosus subsp. pseudoverticillatus]|uniref:DUF2000 domain-containing protein n=1 Tax=Streptomyces rimosus TaxID=1927 RepID=UPI0006B29FEF|nr:DUF2000 domain-containing protein [Streptomyces rimosus]KOT75297.1 hypothetical protein ADK70_39660 [Streptomyces rimosus subsp. pseudoverticillatus]